MTETRMNKNQGHWILARAGKRVLRPGGRKLTLELLKSLDITSADEVVEFAPGMGFTARLVLDREPRSYRGVEINEEVAAQLRQSLPGRQVEIVIGSAEHVPLPDASATCVYAEAMLTMQSEPQKRRIISEAFRLLKPGGRYGIHELGLLPDGLPEEQVALLQRELATAIRVNARPLLSSCWRRLLEEAGFQIREVAARPMSLLKPSRLIEDEGLCSALKIMGRLMANAQSRKRVGEMKRVFRKYRENMNAVALVAVKPRATT